MSSLICWTATRLGDGESRVVMMADSLFSQPVGRDIKRLLSLGPKVFEMPVRVLMPPQQRCVHQDSFVGNGSDRRLLWPVNGPRGRQRVSQLPQSSPEA